jgi:hypothetical protein
MGAAILASIVLHGGAMMLPWPEPEAPVVPEPESIRVILQEDPIVPPSVQQPTRHLVDSVTPSDRPPESTDRIAVQDSLASNPDPVAQNTGSPRTTLVTDADILGQSAPPTTPETPPVAPPSEEQPTTEETEDSEETDIDDAADEATDGPEEADPSDEGPIQLAAVPPERLLSPPIMQVAPAPPPQPATEEPEPPTPDPVPIDRQAPTQSRVEGGAPNAGVWGFEAMQDDLAPYLKEVRKAVERRWKARILLRYHGTNATRAEIDCTIAPTGEIIKVEIIDAGPALSFGALSKQAIEAAGPFPPFPFEVPEIYRNENLRIRWTFSYL